MNDAAQTPLAPQSAIATQAGVTSPATPVSVVTPVSVAAPVPVVPPVSATLPASATDQADKLSAIETALDAAEGEEQSQPDNGVLAQAMPTAVNDATDSISLNPSIISPTTAKELNQKLTTIESTAESTPVASDTVEAGALQMVEQERTPEISPEVEAYIQKVQDHQNQAPKEVVIADGSQGSSQTAYPSKPVVVLPITAQMEKDGATKSPKFSIRWLVEWSHKIIKMFVGKVIYRQD
jgi:hypothetical protein